MKRILNKNAKISKRIYKGTLSELKISHFKTLYWKLVGFWEKLEYSLLQVLIHVSAIYHIFITPACWVCSLFSVVQDIRVVRNLSRDDQNTRNVQMHESLVVEGSPQKSNKSDHPRFQRPNSKEFEERESYHRQPLREGNHDRQQYRHSAEFSDHGTYRGSGGQGGGDYQKLKRNHQHDRPKSDHFDSRQNFRHQNHHDGYQRQQSRENHHDGYQRQQSRENHHDGYQRQQSRENDFDRQGFQNRQQFRKNSHEDYQRRESWENDHDYRSNNQRGFDRRQNSRESDGDQYNRRNFKEKRVEFEFEGSDFEPQAKRKQGGGRGRGSPRKENKGYDFSNSPQVSFLPSSCKSAVIKYSHTLLLA